MKSERDITWRVYLDDIVRGMSSAEKRRVYDTVGVTRTSFQRWRTGENLPDAAHVQPLLNALPDGQRERLLALMMEDPKMQALLPIDLLHPHPPSLRDAIPSTFYAQVLRLQRDTADRFWLVCSVILRDALLRLETSPPSGMELTVARCMSPRTDGKIRSLREHVAMGTGPWRGDMHTKETFVGAESLAGSAVMSRYGIMVPDVVETTFPVHSIEHERSATAYPIMRYQALAGALIVASTQFDFFSPERLTLIEQYADLIGLAFSDAELYPFPAIALTLMPSSTVQERMLASFRQRVETEYRRSLQQGQSLQELSQVEQRVREAIEGELIHLATQETIPTDFLDGTDVVRY